MSRLSSPENCSGMWASLRALAAGDACDAASAAKLSGQPGAYLLLTRIAAPLPLRIASLGPAVLPAGWYVYAGSARGPGGIRARAGRHLRRGKHPYWHVDHLTEASAATWAFAVPGGRECALVGALLNRPGYETALGGFGSSDCPRCASHLLAVRGGFSQGPEGGGRRTLR